MRGAQLSPEPAVSEGQGALIEIAPLGHDLPLAEIYAGLKKR